MKTYQDTDSLHGHGKAMPHPKRPTSYTYRGARFGNPISLNRSDFSAKREAKQKKHTAKNHMVFSVAAIVAMFMPRRAGKR